MNKKKHPKLIVLTGPESSGKTVLGRMLADHFNCSFVEEQARNYLEGRPPQYRMDDLLAIGELQKNAIEHEMSESAGLLFADTWIYVLTVWAKVRFGKIPADLHQWKSLIQADLYILCKPDFPWEPDPLREHPGHREPLFQLYRAMLADDRVPYLVAEGDTRARFRRVLEGVEKLID